MDSKLEIHKDDTLKDAVSAAHKVREALLKIITCCNSGIYSLNIIWCTVFSLVFRVTGNSVF